MALGATHNNGGRPAAGAVHATVSEVPQYTSGADVLEDDSFTFQKVQHEDLIAHTMYVDDWETVA